MRSAQQVAAAKPHPRVTYGVARAEASGLDDASVDVITVAAEPSLVRPARVLRGSAPRAAARRCAGRVDLRHPAPQRRRTSTARCRPSTGKPWAPTGRPSGATSKTAIAPSISRSMSSPRPRSACARTGRCRSSSAICAAGPRSVATSTTRGRPCRRRRRAVHPVLGHARRDVSWPLSLRLGRV